VRQIPLLLLCWWGKSPTGKSYLRNELLKRHNSKMCISKCKNQFFCFDGQLFKFTTEVHDFRYSGATWNRCGKCDTRGSLLLHLKFVFSVCRFLFKLFVSNFSFSFFRDKVTWWTWQKLAGLPIRKNYNFFVEILGIFYLKIMIFFWKCGWNFRPQKWWFFENWKNFHP